MKTQLPIVESEKTIELSRNELIDKTFEAERIKEEHKATDNHIDQLLGKNQELYVDTRHILNQIQYLQMKHNVTIADLMECIRWHGAQKPDKSEFHGGRWEKESKNRLAASPMDIRSAYRRIETLKHANEYLPLHNETENLIPVLGSAISVRAPNPIDIANARRTKDCHHPEIGTGPDDTKSLYCTDCKVLFNMGELGTTDQEEFDTLFKGWYVYGSRSVKRAT